MKTIVLLMLLSTPYDVEPEVDIVLEIIKSDNCIVKDVFISVEDDDISMDDIMDALDDEQHPFFEPKIFREEE